MRIFKSLVICVLFVSGGFLSAEEEWDEQVTYEDVEPIFATYCVKCHQGARPKGKLNLKSFPFVKDGSTDDQLGIVTKIVARVFSDAKPMPPRFPFVKPLNEEQKSLIKAWLDDGIQSQEIHENW